MDGALGTLAAGWRRSLIEGMALLAAELDFSDEGDVSDLPASFADSIAALRTDIATALSSIEHGRIVRETEVERRTLRNGAPCRLDNVGAPGVAPALLYSLGQSGCFERRKPPS